MENSEKTAHSHLRVAENLFVVALVMMQTLKM